MQKFGGAAIHMRQNFDSDKVNSILENITYLVGSAENVRYMTNVPAKRIFDEQIMSFLNDISKELLENRENKVYSDIVTLGFWLRWASICHLKERFGQKDNYIRQGRGVVFHIAPSNVPVNYVYSLVCGLLSGNANIVRIPSRDFPQIAVINHAIENALEAHPDVKPYVCLVRYNRNKEVNDLLSSIANLRVLWGGDETIEELRKI